MSSWRIDKFSHALRLSIPSVDRVGINLFIEGCPSEVDYLPDSQYYGRSERFMLRVELHIMLARCDET